MLGRYIAGARIAIGVIVLLVMINCARQSAPTGGDKDVTPPFLLSATPPMNSTNSASKKIHFEFNEYLTLKNFKSQTIISPPLQHGFDYQAKGKGFIFEIKDTLKPNTTYRIDFQSAITDLTEGNASEGLVTVVNYGKKGEADSTVVTRGQAYVFSTGAYLDSLQLTGQVVLANDGLGKKGWTVGLYEELKDSIAFKQQPLFVTRTSDDGYFRFYNLPKGIYFPIAFDDVNGDQKVSTATELVGFKTQGYSPSDTIGPLIYLFKEDTEVQYVKSKEWSQPGKLVVVMNRPASQLSLGNFNVQMKKSWHMIETSLNKDSITLWSSVRGLPDTLKFKVEADLFEEELVVVTTLSKSDVKAKKKSKPENDSLLQIVGHNVGATLAADQKVGFTFADPVVNPEQALFKLSKDSVPVPFSLVTKDPAHRRYQLVEQLPAGDYQLEILPGAVTDIYGRTTDTLIFRFAVLAASNYGRMKVELEGTDWPSQNRLMVKQIGRKTIIDTLTLTKSYITRLLEPGQYTVSAIMDLDQSGGWTSGNLFQQLQPELIVQYPDTITIAGDSQVDVIWGRQ